MGANHAAALARYRQLAERARRIPERFGLRPTKVTVRVRTYSGPVGAQGVTLSATTDTVLDPRPRVRQVTEGQKSYFGGGTLVLAGGDAAARVYEIGPIAQRFPGGGYTPAEVAPPGGVTRRVTVLLEGDAFASGGEEFEVTALDWSRPLHGMVQVMRTRQGA